MTVRKGKRVKPLRGARRMKQFGYRNVGIWLSKEDYAAILAAADFRNQAVATFMRNLALVAVGVMKTESVLSRRVQS
jgi:hypothetical protein